MPRPQSKLELVESASQRYKKLIELLSSATDVELTADFDFGPKPKGKEAHWERDRNTRDVLIHLHEWHRMLIGWTQQNLAGDSKPFLPAPYNWKTYGELNNEFWRAHQTTPYAVSVELLGHSHEQVMGLIEEFTDEQLFHKNYFVWTGTPTLGSYFVSSTSSHYDWALKKIRAHLRASRQTIS